MLIDRKEILIPQKKMGMGIFVAALIVMMTIQWMTLDMYLPALPVLKKEFATSEALLNFSLNSDLAFCAIGTLVGGTISDKYGRKPIMLWGLLLATLPNFIAASAQGVWVLTIMRGLCGLGGGVALTVSTAIIRDSFKGKTFQMITTLTQAAAIVGPVFAPAIGALLIEFMSWRWIFIFLGIAMVISAVPFFVFYETWPVEARQVDSIWQATIQSFNIIKSRDYLIFMAFNSVLIFPMWAYLGTCSYIYYNEFGVSNMEYSILYATGMILAFAAPFLYVWIDRKVGNRRAVEIILVFLAIACILLMAIGNRGPVLYLVAVAPVIMAEAMIRPMTMVVVLEVYPDEAGSASAVTGFIPMVIGVVSTAVATLGWSTFRFGMTVISIGSTVLGILLWILIIKLKVYRRQFEL